MAIKHLYTVICDRVIRDENTGKLTLVDVCSNIVLDSLPGGKQKLFVVVGVTGVVGEVFTMTLEGPGRYKEDPFRIATGEVIEDQKLESQHAAIVTFASVGIKNLGFDAEGLYHFVLRQGEQVIHETPVAVFVSSKKEDGSEHDSPGRSASSPTKLTTTEFTDDEFDQKRLLLQKRMPTRKQIQAIIDRRPIHDPWLDDQHDWQP